MPNQYTKKKGQASLTTADLICIGDNRKFVEHMIAMGGMLLGAVMFFSIEQYEQTALLIGMMAGYAFKNGYKYVKGV